MPIEPTPPGVAMAQFRCGSTATRVFVPGADRNRADKRRRRLRHVQQYAVVPLTCMATRARPVTGLMPTAPGESCSGWRNETDGLTVQIHDGNGLRCRGSRPGRYSVRSRRKRWRSGPRGRERPRPQRPVQMVATTVGDGEVKIDQADVIRARIRDDGHPGGRIDGHIAG